MSRPIAQVSYWLSRKNPTQTTTLSHITAILAADLVEGVGYLSQAAAFDGFQQFGKEIVALQGRLFEIFQGLGGLVLVFFLKGRQSVELVLLDVIGCPGQFDIGVGLVKVGIGVAEGVDSDNGVFAGMLEVLVIEGFLLDLGALVAGFHGTQDTAAFGDAVKFGEHRLFYHIGEFFDDKTALVHVLVLAQPPFAVDDQLYGKGAAHRLRAWCGDGLVIGVGVEAVAVVVDGNESLQRRADIVELDVLAVQ